MPVTLTVQHCVCAPRHCAGFSLLAYFTVLVYWYHICQCSKHTIARQIPSTTDWTTAATVLQVVTISSHSFTCHSHAEQLLPFYHISHHLSFSIVSALKDFSFYWQSVISGLSQTEMQEYSRKNILIPVFWRLYRKLASNQGAFSSSKRIKLVHFSVFCFQTKTDNCPFSNINIKRAFCLADSPVISDNINFSWKCD